MTQINYVLYKTATGEITNWRTVSDQATMDAGSAPAGYAKLECDAAENDYIELTTMTPTPRPTLPDFANPYDLAQLPTGTIVTVTDESGGETVITELTEDLTLLGPETYQIVVDPPFPYMRIKTELEVT